MPLYAVCRVHVDELTGPLGIWQHAVLSEPDPAHGYASDDVARALLVDLGHRRHLGWSAVEASAARSLQFLDEAFVPEAGVFRNFRAADGRWLEAGGSQDCQGRVLLALGTTTARAPSGEPRDRAEDLFRRAIPGSLRLTALRAVASAILGCDEALSLGESVAVRDPLHRLANRLARAFVRSSGTPAWPWPEPILTYENALLPRAMLVAGQRLGDDRLTAMGRSSLDWLLAAQTGADGVFEPIGCHGWWSRGGVRSRFDQQPIEATATILAAVDAYRLTGEPHFRSAAETAYAWFLGANAVGLAVADPATGGCHDGLAADHVNANRGAESTLMWQLALEAVRGLRSGADAAARRPVGGAIASADAAMAVGVAR